MGFTVLLATPTFQYLEILFSWTNSHLLSQVEQPRCQDPMCEAERGLRDTNIPQLRGPLDVSPSFLPQRLSFYSSISLEEHLPSSCLDFSMQGGVKRA